MKRQPRDVWRRRLKTGAGFRRWVLGDERTFTLPQRIAHSTILLLVVACFTCAAIHTVLGVARWARFVSVGVGMAHAGIYLWSRRGRAFPAPAWVSFLLVTFALYPVLWMANFGLDGSTHLVGVGILVYGASVFERWQRGLAVGLGIAMTALLIVLELHHPGVSSDYGDPATRAYHNIATFMTVGLVLAMHGLGTMASYAYERERARDYSALLEKSNGELEAALEQNRQLALTDSLTGLPNRRHTMPLLRQRIEEARRYQRPLAVAMLDIDHFKLVNDQHGHGTGDAILAAFGQLVMRCMRSTDLPARWGGEEFVLVLPETELPGASVVTERIRYEVASGPLACAVTVTVSIGLAAHRAGDSVDTLLARADAALYRAKREGRDRVVTASVVPLPSSPARTA